MATVLVIDDERIICEMIGEILSLHEMDVLKAFNGQDGVSMALDAEPDVILCDVSMPGLDGFGTLELIRSHAALVHTPFIFLTGHSDRASMRRGMELGADDYITKPFRPNELVGSISARLERQRRLRKLMQKSGSAEFSILGVLPHELNTPLQKILGFSDILREDVQELTSEDIAKTADLIHRSAERLHRLTENFLSFAQLERLAHDPEASHQLKQTVLPQIKVQVAEVVEARVKQHDRQDDLAMLLDEAAVHINEAHLTKIVEELVDNACKFSAPGQRVEVVGKMHEDEGMYLLQVGDEGRGMSSDAIQEIGAFRQFDRQLYEQQGVGLGLSLAVRIAELHGGKIKISSAEDEGTIVSVVLRCQR